MIRMPAEWEAHERTWMAFPPPNATFGDEDSPELAGARRVWARVANTVARYEPVTLVAGLGQAALARSFAGPGVDVVEVPLDDAWMRDIGPTFVHDHASPTGLAAVDWRFNGWGAQDWAAWDRDQDVARRVAGLAGQPVTGSALTAEGGGLHVDGEGTVLLTETVQLDPGRNPGWTKARAEAEVHARLGTTTAIWLPRGLTRDYGEFGTRGHVDLVAAFLRPGVVAVHRQADPAHPDHDVSKEIAEVLATSRDARGRRLEVVEIPAPAVLTADGEFVDYSYLNHYVANGVVVLGVFGDPNDAVAADLLRRAHPGRTVELVDARPIFARGGGIHCITQQQPAS
ncbi:agmatine deiminase family protein [Amycolatopsis sp. H20-H5]|uniref:agmatine deiminase family protein n=1 Tax=Amycolatopsis sp. H20-H5 TaxID=3046309 RepID=UPI002DBFFC42|nr:agmatine deiminase family protein [Amycolatopsis sp. H20-H5]MEC3976184.1 agmatine deiminase family protein [Amycolatopsis sp. H20-H5]